MPTQNICHVTPPVVNVNGTLKRGLIRTIMMRMKMKMTLMHLRIPLMVQVRHRAMAAGRNHTTCNMDQPCHKHAIDGNQPRKRGV